VLLERKLSTGKKRIGERNSLSTARDLKLSSSSSLMVAVDLSPNSLVLRAMRLLLPEGEPETLTYEVQTFNLTSGTKSLPSAPFFKMATSLLLMIGATEVGNEQAVERTDEEECIEVRDEQKRGCT